MILKDRVAIVTGGTSGIGEALVRRLAADGAAIVFNGRRQDLGDKIAADTGAIYVKGDVTIPEDVVRTVDRAKQVSGRIDLLVNNAGSSSPYGGILSAEPLEFIHPFNLHVSAAINHIRRALPMMPHGSTIVNISSIAGYRGYGDGRVPYAVSKAALTALTYSLAPELKAFGVRLNCVSPGHLDAGVDVVVDAVMFLASNASRFCTGIDLVVDNGLVCGGTYVK
jgi:NAD(P)-dependent dehydrogenase (short-subunit alcohol dehydrogenase family)